jgi:hypothetical protein
MVQTMLMVLKIMMSLGDRILLIIRIILTPIFTILLIFPIRRKDYSAVVLVSLFILGSCYNIFKTIKDNRKDM